MTMPIQLSEKHISTYSSYVGVEQPSPRHCLKSVFCQVRLGLFFFLLRDTGVNAICQLLTGFLAPLPRLCKRHRRVHPERQCFLLFCEAVIHPPILAAHLDQQMQAQSVSVFFTRRSASRLDVFDEGIGQRHSEPLF